jgi:hypothetical protein
MIRVRHSETECITCKGRSGENNGHFRLSRRARFRRRGMKSADGITLPIER